MLQRCINLLLIACLFVGCATTAKNSTINNSLIYKAQELPPPVEIRENGSLPSKTGAPTPLMVCSSNKGDKCSIPFTGILLDSHLLSKYKLIKVERDTLRDLIKIERVAREQSQNYYNLTILELMEKSKRSWWEKHSGTIGVMSGVVFTSIIVIGLAYALHPAVAK